MARGTAGGDGRAPRGWGTLDRDQIVEASLALAREPGGLAEVTVRRVADTVGCSRMALYRHISDKQELLDLAADRIAADAAAGLALDDPAPWDDRLRTIAGHLRAHLERNPAFAEFMIVRSVHGPGGVRMAELITRAVADTGLTPERVAHYCLVFTDVVLGRIHHEVAGDPAASSRNARLLAAAARTPEASFVRRYTEHLERVSADEVFRTEVDMVVGAIHRELAGTRR